MQDIIQVAPTILMRRGADTDVVMDVPGENALVVFRSEEEVEKFRAYSGLYPASEDFEAMRVDEWDIGRICASHGLSRLAMPEPWTGDSGVDFLEADVFIPMLRERPEE